VYTRLNTFLLLNWQRDDKSNVETDQDTVTALTVTPSWHKVREVSRYDIRQKSLSLLSRFCSVE